MDLIPLEFRDLPLKKVLNWLLTETSVYLKPGRPWGRPTLVQVEPTNRCNLLCQVCPVRTGMNRPRGDMDLEMFRRLIDEVGEYLLVTECRPCACLTPEVAASVARISDAR